MFEYDQHPEQIRWAAGGDVFPNGQFVGNIFPCDWPELRLKGEGKPALVVCMTLERNVVR